MKTYRTTAFQISISVSARYSYRCICSWKLTGSTMSRVLLQSLSSADRSASSAVDRTSWSESREIFPRWFRSTDWNRSCNKSYYGNLSVVKGCWQSLQRIFRVPNFSFTAQSISLFFYTACKILIFNFIYRYTEAIFPHFAA